jgi:hypothetical protein
MKLTCIILFTVTISASASDKLDALFGQPVDLAPWAYAWRADRAVQDQPEAYFIPHRLERIDRVYRTAAKALPPDQLKSIYYNMPDVLRAFPPAPKGKLAAGLLWVGGLHDYELALHWPKDPPVKEAVEVRVYPTSFGWFGWTVDEILRDPTISDDGRTWTFKSDLSAKMDSAYSARVPAATEMVAVFADSGAVPTIAVKGKEIGTWKRLDIEVEGNNLPDQIEPFMAIVGEKSPLPDDREGYKLSLLYAPDARPGLDSRLTLGSKEDGFTIRLRDLDDGPICVFSHRAFINKAGGQTARQYLTELHAKKLDTLREMTREHREAQSWDELMQNVRLWNCPPGTTAPPAPKVPDPPMIVELSDERWTDAWRAACNQLTGKHMWGGLAFEVGRVAREMEMIGLHDPAQQVYDHFLTAPGAKSDGDYSDGNGALELATSMRHDMGYSHDGTHASTGRLLFAMAERYFLTGDRAWFEKNRTRLQAAADWIIRQRRDYMKDVPNRDKLFVAGLMPPQMLGDYALPSCDWHWYYCDNAFALQGLSRFADALAEIDAEAGNKYRAEANDFRKDFHRVLTQEAALSPVRRGRDGLFHHYIPRSAYMRGLTGPELGQPQFPDCDMFMGCLPAAELFGAIDAEDKRMIDTLDVMDEMGTAAFAPAREAERKKKGLPSKDAGFWTPYSRLPKASHNANIYLLQDDVPNFLRFWMNEYAVMVGADGKFWEAWQPDNFKSCEAPDNGTAGWFLENFRNLLVMEEGDALWIARATPRAWLEQGRSIRVKNAPTYFGDVAYEITSDVDHGKITATIDVPNRKAPQTIVLRLRHPKSSPIKGVMVNGKPASDFDVEKETILLKGATGRVSVVAGY